MPQQPLWTLKKRSFLISIFLVSPAASALTIFTMNLAPEDKVNMSLGEYTNFVQILWVLKPELDQWNSILVHRGPFQEVKGSRGFGWFSMAHFSIILFTRGYPFMMKTVIADFFWLFVRFIKFFFWFGQTTLSKPSGRRRKRRRKR